VAADDRPRAAINVDVDGLYLYDRVHGVAASAGNAPGFRADAHDPKAWTIGVVRFLDLFRRAGVRATLFTVAQDLDRADVRAVIADAVRAGHEIGNHSASHPYDLSRLPARALQAEVGDARKRLQDATGQPVAGFRAPGYVLSPPLLEAIADAGHGYDSSRFPCPSYQAAKAAAIAAYRAGGRPSGSIAEPTSVWFGAREPYLERLASGRTLVELPIGTLPWTRLPMIGTAAVVGGAAWRALAGPVAARTRWVNFELHAIDVLDHAVDDLPATLLRQPDQRVPLARKWPLLLRWFEDLAASHDVRPLADWAASV